ncbi:acetyltransferase [Calycina marina]|uniref:Acetyltransferase n=1 Tax=Calycina marina TaxID=1763456 RepID=A0A9P7Z830_9HELO|nr:acetyltransferase [Calycina marina]
MSSIIEGGSLAQTTHHQQPQLQPKIASTIRLATEADIPAICHLGASTFTSTFGYSMPASDLQTYLSEVYTHAAVAADILDPLITTFVATFPASPLSEIRGFAQMYQGPIEECVTGPKPVELKRLYVDAKYQGGGVGGALFQRIESWAKDGGFATMWLGVWEENLNAQRAYGRFGFKERVGKHDFVMGTCVQTDWIMVKSLKE